jgi:hypothetical protein
MSPHTPPSGRGLAATGAAVAVRPLVLPLLLLLHVTERGALGQVVPLSINYAFPCKAGTEFFDISSLTCQPCNQVRGRTALLPPLPAARLSCATHGAPSHTPLAHFPCLTTDRGLLPIAQRPQLRPL